MSFERSTDAATEPVSLTEVKAHLRLTAPGGEAAYTDEDSNLTILIKSARRVCERYTERSFITQTWKAYFDEFPEVIELLYGPVISITSIQYVDSDGDTQTMDAEDYRVDLKSKITRITPVDEWPDIDDVTNSVTVTYTAGFGAAAVVPEDIKAAMLLIIGTMYANREDTIKKMPNQSEWLLDSHKVYHAL